MKKSRTMRLTICLLSVITIGWVMPTQAQSEGSAGPIVSQSVRHSTSAPLRDLIREPRVPYEGEPREINPLGQLPKTFRSTVSLGSERLLSPQAPEPAPDPIVSFRGMDNVNGFSPPDTIGDVGPNHYVQAVNTSYAVFDKSNGALLLGPFDVNDIWSGAGGKCQSENDGDPIVLYDSTNDRWMISQFYIFGIGPTWSTDSASRFRRQATRLAAGTAMSSTGPTRFSTTIPTSVSGPTLFTWLRTNSIDRMVCRGQGREWRPSSGPR